MFLKNPIFGCIIFIYLFAEDLIVGRKIRHVGCRRVNIRRGHVAIAAD